MAVNRFSQCHTGCTMDLYKIHRRLKMAKSKRVVTEYRSYYLPMQFPVLLLSGDYWKISDIPSGSLHFHNCLEIGLCHSDSGTLEINGDKQSFHAGDVTILPRNVPHTTYSTPGTRSHWSYLFLDPRSCFTIFSPLPGKITTCPQMVSQASVIFSVRILSSYQLSGVSYHP